MKELNFDENMQGWLRADAHFVFVERRYRYRHKAFESDENAAAD